MGDSNGGMVILDKSNLFLLSLVGALALTTFSYGLQYSYADASISLIKTCDPVVPNQLGTITWTFTIGNNGTEPLTNFKLNDPDLGFNNVTISNSILPAGSSFFPLNTNQTNLLEGVYSNNATVNALINGTAVRVTSNVASDTCVIDPQGPPTHEGDIIQQFNSTIYGVGMAFDGYDFYLPNGITATQIVVMNTTGGNVRNIELQDGCQVGNLTWDVAGNRLFGYDILPHNDGLNATSISVMQIDPDTGICTELFDPLSTMLANGECGERCHWPPDGIDYDERDKLLWISSDASKIVYQFDLEGNLVGTIMPINTTDVCGLDWSSGIATGEGNILYSASGPCDWVSSWDKDTDPCPHPLE